MTLERLYPSELRAGDLILERLYVSLILSHPTEGRDAICCRGLFKSGRQATRVLRLEFSYHETLQVSRMKNV